MQEVFEKIIEKQEELFQDLNVIEVLSHVDFDSTIQNSLKNFLKSITKESIEIVKQEAEQYNNGWIPCSERLPEECVPVNVTWINRKPELYYEKIKDVPFSATAVYYNSKWYWYSSTCVDYLSEYGKNDFDLVEKNIDIIAWKPLPHPYQPKGE